jgi:hypothetical protein
MCAGIVSGFRSDGEVKGSGSKLDGSLTCERVDSRVLYQSLKIFLLTYEGTETSSSSI